MLLTFRLFFLTFPVEETVFRWPGAPECALHNLIFQLPGQHSSEGLRKPPGGAGHPDSKACPPEHPTQYRYPAAPGWT